MGTVGLSFGSPTSGTGFDVSSTVASIVSNLQNVETPWKNQLTSLESEDTAISSLGTLFSTLSNDVSQLTDFQGAMAVKSGSSSDTNVLELTSASTSATAGTHTVVVNSLAQSSSGYLAEIANAADKLSGSVTLQAGSGSAQTITLTSSDNTLAGLASAINSSGVGVTASVLTDATGSRLSLVSGISGAGGDIAISSNSLTAAVSNTLSYKGTAGTQTQNSTGTLSPVSSAQASLSGKLLVTVGGGAQQTIDMSDVSTAEGGATLGDLAKYIGDNSTTLGFSASVAANSDGTSSLSLTSGTPESAGTLTVSSSLVDSATALGYTNTVTGANASLTVDGVSLTSASNTVTNLIPGLTFQLLSTSPEQSDNSLEPVQVVIANDNGGVESAVNQMVSDYNSLISAVNTQEGNTSSGTPEPLFGSPTLSLLQEQLLSGLNIQNPNGSLNAVTNVTNPVLTGSITIQVGDGKAQTITLNSSQTSLSDLAQAINSAQIGVTAGVATASGQSTLTLASQTEGSTGALTVTSNIVNTSDTQLTAATTSAASSSQSSSASFSSIPNAGDALSGSVIIQVGSGTAITVNVPASHSLADFKDAINNTPGVGVTASITPNSDGSQTLSLLSNTSGSDGDLTVTSNLMDTTNKTISTLGYTNSSDIGSLTTLGIGVNDDGSLTFDDSTLDSVLNADFSSVAGFFQSANSWGQSFANILTGAGTGSSTGILSLASSSNSSIESELNAKISSEGSLISEQQSSLTTELNQANEILQELPSQLNGMNELYSAITGYGQNMNG